MKYLSLAAIAIALLYAAAPVSAADPADVMLPQVKNIYLDTNGCTPQFTEQLQDAGYHVTSDRESSDAVFKVDVHQLDASMGASARYAVTLQRHDGYELFGQSGREDSIDQEELCEDISEDMVDALVARSSAIP